MNEFEQFYSQHYGDRWPALLAALKQPEKRVLRQNQYGQFPQMPDGRQIQDQHLRDPSAHVGEIQRGENTLLTHYVLDEASIWPALALDPQEGDSILDLCAAPGGKTLILAERIKDSGDLIANEMSAGRRDRLVKVIQNYIPRSVRDRIWVKGVDGAKFGLTHREKFDRILVDAPCSGERHLFEAPEDLEEWSASKSKKMSQRQLGLLSGAWHALKPGGRLVYSTCSISPFENDGVIEKLQTRFENVDVEVALHPQSGFNRTRYGIEIFPDTGNGIGPIYYSSLKKKITEKEIKE